VIKKNRLLCSGLLPLFFFGPIPSPKAVLPQLFSPFCFPPPNSSSFSRYFTHFFSQRSSSCSPPPHPALSPSPVGIPRFLDKTPANFPEVCFVPPPAPEHFPFFSIPPHELSAATHRRRTPLATQHPCTISMEVCSSFFLCFFLI